MIVAVLAVACASGGANGSGSPVSLDTTVSAVISSTTVDTTGEAAISTTVPTIAPALAALAGHTIVVDPGHNGKDSAHPKETNTMVFIGNGSKICESTGTAGNDGYPEHAYTWDVANRLEAILISAGARVVMTRDSDDGWGPCNVDRARIGNEAHGELAVSIHADGAATSARGFHVIRPVHVPGYNDGIVDRSNQFATLLRDSFESETGMPTANYIATDGLISRSDLGGLNMSTVPKVFIECGNMRNATDESMLTDPGFRQKAAEAIAEAMDTYFSTK
ncbi:MAG: N-acetylmuramoyl-L-alanine amidase [Acidimicrobiales bacterium]